MSLPSLSPVMPLSLSLPLCFVETACLSENLSQLLLRGGGYFERWTKRNGMVGIPAGTHITMHHAQQNHPHMHALTHILA